MRVKINFKIIESKYITVNYNIHLTALIYRFLNASNHNFAKFIHDTGYKIDKKPFKLFVFSDLHTSVKGIKDGNLILKNDNIDWYISSPVDDFILHLVQGLFIKGNEVILDNKRLYIDKVEVLATPEFNDVMHFKLISPLVLSTLKEFNGKMQQYYLRYYDDCSGNILNNLKRKFELITGQRYTGNTLRITFNNEYINRQKVRGIPNHKVCSSLRHILKYNPKTGNYDDIKIKGIVCPFEIKASPKLIKIAYECGFGEKNSTGFGMVDIL